MEDDEARLELVGIRVIAARSGARFLQRLALFRDERRRVQVDRHRCSSSNSECPAGHGPNPSTAFMHALQKRRPSGIVIKSRLVLRAPSCGTSASLRTVRVAMPMLRAQPTAAVFSGDAARHGSILAGGAEPALQAVGSQT